LEIKTARFMESLVSMSAYTDRRLPEIAVAGRSNVGKSSFINQLGNNKKLAWISSKPGKTRTINFYQINDAFMLVDLPGYGYASVSHKDTREWAKFIEAYLGGSGNLVHLMILVDIRHDPNDNDILMVEYARSRGISLSVIATKCDKVSKQARKALLEQICRRLRIGANDIFTFSAEDGEGKQTINKRLESIVQTCRI
jgi:GTP-binding protein